MKEKYDEAWFEKYNLAKKYYEHYGNLEVQSRFKTIDGVNYDDNGVNLGFWIYRQRKDYKNNKLSKEKEKLLKEISMRFDDVQIKNSWYKMYELLKKYYNHYGNINIKEKFRTNDGINYDDKGKRLGVWIVYQRKFYREGILTSEQIELLSKLGMNFNNLRQRCDWQIMYELLKDYKQKNGNINVTARYEVNDNYRLGNWIRNQKLAYKNNKLSDEKIKLLTSLGLDLERNMETKWLDTYNLAKKYFEHYGNLNIKEKFKTKDGINYDETGYALGAWLFLQKKKLKDNELGDKELNLLLEIGFTTLNTIDVHWNDIYSLAKNYYNHYGNLKIHRQFKTKDGINYDETGYALGAWISSQKLKFSNDLNCNKAKLLMEIGMDFDYKKRQILSWNEMYFLAKLYYIHYGNLKINNKFKTFDGINYDENGYDLGGWLQNQKTAYKGKCQNKINEKQIKLLEEIDIVWLSDNVDLKYQREIITEDNIARKKKEILNRARSILLMYKDDDIPNKDEINDEFIKRLNK